MKKNYFLYFTACTSLLLSLNSIEVNAQVINKSILYVKDNSTFHVSKSEFSFASPAISRTTRAINYGVVSFGATSTAAGASNTHYVDGYTRYYGTQSLVVPCGHNNDGGVYAPAKITPTASTGVDVSYDRLNPQTTISSDIDSPNITAISEVEYWNIKGATTSKITLSWRSTSGLAALLSTPSLAFVTIVGYNGTTWVEIPSFYDTNSLTGGSSTATAGSITSTSAVALSSFEAFTIGVKGSGTCYPVVTSSGNLKVWSGTWSPSEPEFNDPVRLDAPFSGSLNCYSVNLNGNDITLGDTDVMDVISSFTDTSTAANGKVVMSSDATLIQRDDNATPPTIDITKLTRPMRRFDYVFISSPINNFSTFFTDLQSIATTSIVGATAQSTPTFYNFFTSVESGAQVNVTANNVPLAQGLGAAVNYDSPAYANNLSTAGAWYTEKKVIQMKTTGTTNNGIIPVIMPSAAGWLRLGNPYPSPINADKLLDAMGGDFRQTLYFWTFTTPRTVWPVTGSNYQAADYATYTRLGGTAATLTNTNDGTANPLDIPNGFINTMQSVFVRKLNPNPAPTFTFNLNNCLRDNVGNNNFFRPSQDNRIGKFRINLVGSASSFSQILVGYHPETTLDYDNGYDAPRMTGATASELNSLIGTSTTGYVIQGRPTFSVTDVIPLQLATRTQETFTISLQNKEGFFTTDPITIYLHDTFTNVYHDLSQGAYSFTASSGTNNNRFKIVYQNSNLGVGDAIVDNAFATINNDVLLVKANRMIQKVQLFDLTGRLIKTYDNVNNLEMRDAFNKPQSVYLAKITLDNNVVVTQKIINN